MCKVSIDQALISRSRFLSHLVIPVMDYLMCCCNPLVGSMLIDTSALDSVLPVMICLSKLFQSAVGWLFTTRFTTLSGVCGFSLYLNLVKNILEISSASLILNILLEDRYWFYAFHSRLITCLFFYEYKFSKGTQYQSYSKTDSYILKLKHTNNLVYLLSKVLFIVQKQSKKEYTFWDEKI